MLKIILSKILKVCLMAILSESQKEFDPTKKYPHKMWQPVI